MAPGAFYAQGKAPDDTTPVIVVNKKVLKNGTVCKGAKLPSPSLIGAKDEKHHGRGHSCSQGFAVA